MKRPLLIGGLLVGLLVGLLCCGVCGALAVAGAASFGNDGEWSPTAIAQAVVPQIFGVTLPTTLSDFFGHNEGFQDWFGAVAFRMPAADLSDWLASNHLSRGGVGAGAAFQRDEAVAVIVARSAPQGIVRVTILEGFVPPDGGSKMYRSGAVLEWDDQVWVYLEAFDT